MRNHWAAFALVGPRREEVVGWHDLVESLRAYPPLPDLWVLVDDSAEERSAELIQRFPTDCELLIIKHPLRQAGRCSLLGRLCAGTLAALQVVHERGPFEFVLKVDTDALIIGSFAEALSEIVNQTSRAGIIGCIGRTCRREDPDYGFEGRTVSRLLISLARAETTALNFIASNLRRQVRDGDKSTDLVTAEPLAMIQQHIFAAINNGYSMLEYCQGGAYAVTGRMIERMSVLGSLTDKSLWGAIPVGEDVMMGMYAKAVGLELVDCSGEDGIFGVHFDGLAYPPEDMLRRGYALVHSVKRYIGLFGDDVLSERDIRAYFENVRCAVVRS